MQVEKTQNQRSLGVWVSGVVRRGSIIKMKDDRFGEVLLIEEDRLICESFPPGEFFEVGRRRDFDEPGPNEPRNEMFSWEGVSGIVMNACHEDGQVYSDVVGGDTSRQRKIAAVFSSWDETVPLEEIAAVMGWSIERSRFEFSLPDGDGVPWKDAVDFILAYGPYSDIAAVLEHGSGRRINPQYEPTLITVELPRFLVRNIEASSQSRGKDLETELYDVLWEYYGEDRPSYEADWTEEGGAS